MKILGRSWLGALNYYVLQWTCYRLARHVDDGGKTVSWSFLGPVAPRSGWGTNNPYRWLKKRH